jgi:membrane-bound serine protease (ClpP class)
MTAKRLADASAYIRSLAQLRGRNAEWAEKAVRESVSLSAREALSSKVVDLIANDVPDLLRQLDGRQLAVAGGSVRLATSGAPLVTYEADWRSRLLTVITDPSLALILMLVGIYGLLFEFSNPGFVLPGVVGGICLLLALFALQMLPVNYAGLGLILLGIAFLVAEAFLPSFGVLGFGGIVAFAAGAVLLIDSDSPAFGIPLTLIAVLTAGSAAFILAVVGMAAKARRRPVVSGASALLGAPGELLEFAGGEGWAMVRGEHWRVRGAAPLLPGTRVRVVGVRDLTLEVAAEPGGTVEGA